MKYPGKKLTLLLKQSKNVSRKLLIAYLGDFLISFDVISDAKIDGDGDRGGGDSDPGDKVFPSRA